MYLLIRIIDQIRWSLA